MSKETITLLGDYCEPRPSDIECSLTLLCSNRYTWQEETIPTLEDLMDNLAITFE